jgi:hypothetical protein
MNQWFRATKTVPGEKFRKSASQFCSSTLQNPKTM